MKELAWAKGRTTESTLNQFPAVKPTPTPNWKLIFDDEFNGTYLDTSKWNVEDYGPAGYQNCCLYDGSQYYTSQALSFSNGSLQITTKKQTIEGHSYTSGAITTQNKFSFLYGRIDIRVKLPKSQGFWPAIWLLPNGNHTPAPFEIDIMEMLGETPHIVYSFNHWGNHQTTARYVGPDFSQGFHVFSIVWEPQEIAWYIDGVQRSQTSQGISNQKMYLIINAALGGMWPGAPNKNTITPQSMYIDYVRVYQ